MVTAAFLAGAMVTAAFLVLPPGSVLANSRSSTVRRSRDSGGRRSMIATMTAAVSARTERSEDPRAKATGGPKRTSTSGGSLNCRRFGTFAERAHTFSVPQSPTGITGTSGALAANRATPVFPESTGSKNSSPRGIVPCGRITTASPPSSATAAWFSGSSDAVPRSTRIAPIARAIWPTTGASNTSFFPMNRPLRPAFPRPIINASGSK